jgi:hypothetical protein
LALISTCQEIENSIRLRGAPLTRGKTSEKSRKEEKPSVLPIEVEFLNNVFMLFNALLTLVFDYIVFNPTEIIQSICLGPFLLKKCFLEMKLIGYVKFLLLFLPVCNYHNRKGRVHSSQEKKQNEAILSG